MIWGVWGAGAAVRTEESARAASRSNTRPSWLLSAVSSPPTPRPTRASTPSRKYPIASTETSPAPRRRPCTPVD